LCQNSLQNEDGYIHYYTAVQTNVQYILHILHARRGDCDVIVRYTPGNAQLTDQ